MNSVTSGGGPPQAPRPACHELALDLLQEGLRLGASVCNDAALARLGEAQKRLTPGPDAWTVLVAGLCSVGKSSFVCALWGDAELLPTAVRDCTQTNTLVRVPAQGEADRGIRIAYLTRAEALDFALRDLSFHRVGELLREILGPMGPRMDEGPAEERLRDGVEALKDLFRARRDLAILYEYLADDLEKLGQFLAFLEAPAYRPGQTVSASWDERREQLMGRRRPDGRTIDTGPQLACRHVELLRATRVWPLGAADPLGHPRLLDTPWVPTFHNARRAELILAQARTADVLVLLSLPQAYEPEAWVLQILDERPELASRTLVVYSQVDTVDASALFAREGFFRAFEENAKRLAKLGLRPENLLLACARLPFLELGPRDAAVEERIGRLKTVLARLARQAALQPETPFRRKLLAACEPLDAGVESVRARLLELGRGEVLRAHMREALAALEGLWEPATRRAPPSDPEAWARLAECVRALRARLHAER